MMLLPLPTPLPLLTFLRQQQSLAPKSLLFLPSISVKIPLLSRSELDHDNLDDNKDKDDDNDKDMPSLFGNHTGEVDYTAADYSVQRCVLNFWERIDQQKNYLNDEICLLIEACTAVSNK
jgi:hypothetical protein